MKVFLSASVPLPNRDPVFLKTVDVIAIREAIKALVFVLLERNGTMVFGGHPAITPLISILLQEAGVSLGEHIKLYQSSYFGEIFPPENEEFKHIVLVGVILVLRFIIRSSCLLFFLPRIPIVIGRISLLQFFYNIFPGFVKTTRLDQ